MRIDELEPCLRPRERLLKRGPAVLADEELLAVLLRTGYAGCGALDLARSLLEAHPGGALARLSPARLAGLKGVGRSRACVLSAGFELARRWRSSQEDALPMMDSPARVFERLSDLRGRSKEHLVGFYLNACNKLVHQETISVGTLTASLVHPREVFSPALERSAAGVVVAHNHPSGELVPSSEDIQATRRLAAAGKLLGIPLLDHVIVTRDAYMSFREKGLMGDV
ncbi:MAG: DNA repair protein RadC [Elusimicrobiota bacterium]|jgi:DNA repair protein RadC